MFSATHIAIRVTGYPEVTPPAQTFNEAGPEVSFEDIANDVIQARFERSRFAADAFAC